jgi:hypothetical protein
LGKAMVLQQGKEKFVFVFCDLIGLTPKVSTNARLMASNKTGIPVKNILVAATHSHTGPLLLWIFSMIIFIQKRWLRGRPT